MQATLAYVRRAHEEVGRWGDLLLGLILPLKIHEASGRYFLHCEEGNLGRLRVVRKSVNLKGPWNKGPVFRDRSGWLKIRGFISRDGVN